MRLFLSHFTAGLAVIPGRMPGSNPTPDVQPKCTWDGRLYIWGFSALPSPTASQTNVDSDSNFKMLAARRTPESPRWDRRPDSPDRTRAPVNRVLCRPDKPGFLPSRVGHWLTKEGGALPLYGLGSQGLPGLWEFPVLALAGVFWSFGAGLKLCLRKALSRRARFHWKK